MTTHWYCRDEDGLTWRTTTEPTEIMGMWSIGDNAKWIDPSWISEAVLPRRAKMMVMLPAESDAPVTSALIDERCEREPIMSAVIG